MKAEEIGIKPRPWLGTLQLCSPQELGFLFHLLSFPFLLLGRLPLPVAEGVAGAAVAQMSGFLGAETEHCLWSTLGMPGYEEPRDGASKV